MRKPRLHCAIGAFLLCQYPAGRNPDRTTCHYDPTRGQRNGRFHNVPKPRPSQLSSNKTAVLFESALVDYGDIFLEDYGHF